MPLWSFLFLFKSGASGPVRSLMGKGPGQSSSKSRLMQTTSSRGPLPFAEGLSRRAAGAHTAEEGFQAGRWGRRELTHTAEDPRAGTRSISSISSRAGTQHSTACTCPVPVCSCSLYMPTTYTAPPSQPNFANSNPYFYRRSAKQWAQILGRSATKRRMPISKVGEKRRMPTFLSKVGERVSTYFIEACEKRRMPII